MKIWILLTFAFSPCLCIQDNHQQILESLANDFRCLPSNNQFAVMYMPPPNATAGSVSYVPGIDNAGLRCSTGYVTFPRLTNHMISNGRYPYTYAATTPDYNGRVYANALSRPSGRGNTIHTEVLSLDLVFPRMNRSYHETYSFQGPNTIIYLFTYYLPCPNCYNTIHSFVSNNRHTRLYVGYTSLYGGNREREDSDRSATRQRRNDLRNLLNNQHGRLYQVGERFPPQCQRPPRQGRNVPDINICGKNEYAAELYLTMDFSSGNAIAWFHGLSTDTDGWFGLYDKRDNRVTWKWSYSANEGTINFNTEIKDGMYAKYFTARDESTVSIITADWDNTCNFQLTLLNSLPSNQRVYIDLTVDDEGYLYVCLFPQNIDYWSPDSYDWVAIQSISKFSSGQYEAWDWVSNFEPTTKDGRRCKCRQITTLKSSLSEGFRAKYVYNNGDYQYEGLYDNASPFCTPDECPGARGVRM